jgi:PAS domain S-box-containing protein
VSASHSAEEALTGKALTGEAPAGEAPTEEARPEEALTLPPEPASVAIARHFVDGRLRAAQVSDDVIDTATLLTSELVTNAVLHAGTEIEVRVVAAPDVRVEVVDRSPELPRRRTHSAESVIGRGLELVEALATHFGVGSEPENGTKRGKRVWFSLAGPPVGEPDVWEDAGPVDAVPPATYVVELRRLPVLLYEVMREHYEAMLREYSLAQLDGGDDGTALLQEVSEGERSRQLIAEAFTEWKLGQDEKQMPAYVDLQVPVPDDRVTGFTSLGNAVVAAEGLAGRGEALTRPPLPEIVWLKKWVLDEVAHQLAGGRPRAWELREDTDVQDTPARELALDGDGDVVADLDKTGQAAVVVNSANRIVAVSASAAQLLGYAQAELVGRRLTVMIPPRFRQAHIAGFSRQLLTGRRSILGRAVPLRALRRDGTELPLDVTINRHQDDVGTTYFRAVLEPLSATPTQP